MDLHGLIPLMPFFIIGLTLTYPTLSKYTIETILLIYWMLPVVFHYSAWFRRLFVFAHLVKPVGKKIYDGEAAGFRGVCKNFKLLIDPVRKYELGMWHILPLGFLQNTKRLLYREKWEVYLKESENPIFIYLHGNSGTRAQPNRMQLYALLQSMDFHVIAFDYRGYGDSTNATPTETGLVSDAIAVFNYVYDIIGEEKTKERVFIWGHSLGTAVACHALAELSKEGKHPAGVILEAPFTNIKDAVRNYHLTSIFYKDTPAFDYIFVQPLHDSGIRFESNLHIAKIKAPIFILHAVDDTILPFHMGKELYLTAKKTRPFSYGPVYFQKFGKNYGHLYICNAPELPDLIQSFVISSISDKQPRCKNPSISLTDSNDYNNNPCT